MLSSTWSIAWLCTSPPGVPNGRNSAPLPLIASAGLGVKRGRLPGAAPAGWRGSGRDCEPRLDGMNPTPGTTGEPYEPSLGVAEKMLPQRSATQTYEVSGSGNGLGGLARRRCAEAPSSPGGGISGHALSGRISFRRSAAYSDEISVGSGTCPTAGSV